MQTAVEQQPVKGYISRQFTAWCGICGDFQMESAPSLEKFIESISSKWRATTDKGWVHIKCCKQMPMVLKTK